MIMKAVQAEVTRMCGNNIIIDGIASYASDLPCHW